MQNQLKIVIDKWIPYLNLLPVMMDDRIFIGIDPGKSGGYCVIYNDNHYVKPCPNTISDMADELTLIKEMAPDIPMYCAIENVHSWRGQGVRSVWTFAENYGNWLGILATLKIPYIQVSPHKWMKHFGSLPKEKKDRKNKLKHLAQQRYPDLKVTLKVADAILIATYLRETNKQ